MSPVPARSTYAIAFARCLRRAVLPAVVAAAAAAAGAWWFEPRLGDGTTAPGAMTPWLALPMIVVAAVVAGTAIVLWPPFTARSPGTDWIERVRRGPLAGCGAVLCGALAAQLALTLPLTTWLARGLGAPATAVGHVPLPAPQPSAVLSPERPQLGFTVPPAGAAAAIELRPLTAPPGGTLVASRLVVRGDGERLGAREIEFDSSGQTARLTFAPRPLREIRIELVAGNVPLFFPDGAVVIVEAGERNGAANGVLCAAVWLLPTFVALALACLCGAVAARPTVLTVAFAVLVMLTLAGVGPANAALLALLRGHWLTQTGIFTAGAPSLAAGSAAMIAAMLLRRRHRA